MSLEKATDLTVVALFTRAWIEMKCLFYCHTLKIVALFTRAWIEINLYSLVDGQTYVALFTRAWIEIAMEIAERFEDGGRPLHEGVD